MSASPFQNTPLITSKVKIMPKYPTPIPSTASPWSGAVLASLTTLVAGLALSVLSSTAHAQSGIPGDSSSRVCSIQYSDGSNETVPCDGSKPAPTVDCKLPANARKVPSTFSQVDEFGLKSSTPFVVKGGAQTDPCGLPPGPATPPSEPEQPMCPEPGGNFRINIGNLYRVMNEKATIPGYSEGQKAIEQGGTEIFFCAPMENVTIFASGPDYLWDRESHGSSTYWPEDEKFGYIIWLSNVDVPVSQSIYDKSGMIVSPLNRNPYIISGANGEEKASKIISPAIPISGPFTYSIPGSNIVRIDDIIYFNQVAEIRTPRPFGFFPYSLLGAGGPVYGHDKDLKSRKASWENLVVTGRRMRQ